MYLAIVVLTMFVLPLASVAIEHGLQPDAALLALVGRWFVFWGVGVRLGLAGLRQLLRPTFTAREIFGIESPQVLPIVRELGLANAAAALVALFSLALPSFVLPTAISAGIFYAGAGVMHLSETGRSRNETVAMVSDLFIAFVLLAFAAARLLRL